VAVILAWAVTVAGPAPAGTIVTVNSNNVLVLNGRKVFPIGFSPGPPTYGVTPTGKDAMQEFRDAGALLFRMVQTGNWDAQMIANQQAAMDWAAQHDMYCWLNLRELSKFPAGDTNTEAELRLVVNTFKNHPALGLWKNFDEAWWAGVSVDDLKRGYDVIHQEDTNHPVVQTHAPRGTVADLQPYNVAADILAVDIYPVTASGSASNPPITNTAVSQVGDWTKALGQVANGQKEYWTIEQIAFSGTTPPNKILVFPTFTQSRYMAYQAIINGARGLLFFGGNIAATLNEQDAPLGWNWTFWTNVLKRVVEELGDHSLLADALVAPDSVVPVTMSGTTPPDVEFCLREAPPYLYLLASKREGSNAVNVTFSGLPPAVTGGDVLYESGRTIGVTNGQFTDSFAQWDVHVYRFPYSNQPPIILLPPASRTNSLGQTATFSVTAYGSGPLTYQWRRNGTNLVNGGNVSGATTTLLSLASVSASDAADYSVVVSGVGSVTSAPPAVLVVDTNVPWLAITAQPQGATVVAGSTVTLTVTAAGTTPMLYQWQKNGANLADGGHVSGANTAALTLSNVTFLDSGSYTVAITNAAGGTNSAAASLSVIHPMPYYDPFAYPAGANLGGNTNADLLSWADIGTSTAGPYITVRAGSLAVPGLAGPAGNSIRFGGLGKSVRFSLPTDSPVTNGTLYYSFATQVIDTNGLSPTGIFVAGFNNTPGPQANQPTVIGTRVYLRLTDGGFNLGVSKNSSITSEWVWDPRTFTTNDTLFLVGSYTFNPASTNDDIARLWINPDLTAFGSAVAPAPSIVASNGTDISGNKIASFIFVQRSASQPALMYADELRIGRAWADVTPRVALRLLGPEALPDGSFRFRYTNSSPFELSVYASTNLTQWSAIGSPTLIAPGWYQFTDSAAAGFPRRFYQLRSP
jgi:hypothetical protein